MRISMHSESELRCTPERKSCPLFGIHRIIEVDVQLNEKMQTRLLDPVIKKSPRHAPLTSSFSSNDDQSLS
ncbi:hypothetical protein MPTK1_5g22910 [Marchantia polymorpha subsp. ruderalis]|uniref:Uncharacterized protein n=2 Tax=Marchantia polymorpha TaxID=3197 RepID=A0AAF6BLA6_MARPO|nr:hypothetical protein MARPO_0010s0165 [Marchantia polymorpha]BBN12790.1 hypothetical protein Mp_5g22910 [Marchantia polymorpha subsp. ruderalis]|eukprot:PTQ46789.1 hypothetical protein MARPO_0010s0165 [Marchantia polymorpha]